MCENDESTYSEQKFIKIPTEKQLEQMVLKEREIRESEKYINQCTDVKDEVNGWLRITGEMQKQLVKDFGYNSDIESDIACNLLRRAHLEYPDNQIFKTVPIQVINNKANQGDLQISTSVKDMMLYDLLKNKTHLHNILTNDKENIVLLGSHT